MNTDMSLISLVIEASVVVQLVLLILVLASMASWSIIFHKARMVSKATKAADVFESDFWSGGELNTLYRKLTSSNKNVYGMEAMFESGFKGFLRLRKQQNADPEAMVEAAQRSMRVVMNKQIDALENRLPFLATVGSTSPYIGLLGTVWGIMNSFRALGDVQQATLSMVAPGIAEALIATAMGLFAAIPAVIAFNRYNTDVERLIGRYDNFMEEFASILHRQAHV
ncbi:MAG: protein TolQ [Gammaproteobacteria bacterium]|nr:protein TolQ [Gammaproteobacteria bacterium]PCH64803.1 MAG: protein TolQ [Gammaproteobacteria bacterium]